MFLQLTQRASGEVDAVIPNTPEAELKALQINHQVAVWCLNYWADTNPGGKAFFNKLANRAFNHALLHKVRKCAWDSATQTVTSPSAQSEIAAIAEFEDQGWLKDIINVGTAKEGAKKTKVGGPAGEFPANIFYPSRIPKKNPSANNHKKPQKTSGQRTDGGERFTP